MSSRLQYLTQLYKSAEPSAEPVSTADAKTHMRVSGSGDDTYIDTLVKAARIYVENRILRQLINATWVATFSQFPTSGAYSANDVIFLPWPPLSSVTSVAYKDTSGDSQTVTATNYTVVTGNLLGEIHPIPSYTWPNTQDDVPAAVTVTYISGYGSAGSSVPASIILAIKLLAGFWYENRETAITGEVSRPVPFSVDALLNQYKVWEAR